MPSIGDSWELASEPTLVIGADLESVESLLSQVSGAGRLSDGRVVIADGGLSSRLSVFSPHGRWLSSIGRAGEGPGEYRFLTSLQIGPEDSFFVYDANLRRVTAFPPSGGEPRILSVHPATNIPGNGLRSILRLAGGDVWVGRGIERMFASEPGKILRDTISIGLLDAEMTSFRVLADLPDLMFTTVPTSGGRRGFGGAAFSPRVIHAVWGRCVFVGTGEGPQIFVFDVTGERVTEFEGPGSLRRVTAEHLDARVESIRKRFSDAEEAESALDQFERQAKPEYLPYYHDIVVDQWGHLWLQEYAPPYGFGKRWTVLSQTGEPIGEVLMPRNMTVYSIAEHGVLGRSLGELDEEIVELFPFTQRRRENSAPLDSCVGS